MPLRDFEGFGETLAYGSRLNDHEGSFSGDPKGSAHRRIKMATLNRLRRGTRTVGTAAVVWTATAGRALADASFPLVLAQQEDGTQIVDGSRSYVLDVFIVVVLFGLALFSVCRSSRRV